MDDIYPIFTIVAPASLLCTDHSGVYPLTPVKGVNFFPLNALFLARKACLLGSHCTICVIIIPLVLLWYLDALLRHPARCLVLNSRNLYIAELNSLRAVLLAFIASP